jgi:hypothetical protein
MNKKAIIGCTIIIVVITLFYLYNYVLYKSQRNISSEVPSYELESTVLANEYTSNSQIADQKYLNKTIVVKGKVTEVEDSLLVLDKKIFCKMNKKMTKNLNNDEVSVKGRCIGYDDLFEIIQLDQCSN